MLVISMATICFAQDVVISVNDLSVESDNAQFKYLGKGMAILVASDLRKSSGVKIIEREAMNKILKEQEFSVSDLADRNTQIKIGKLVLAKYILAGNIVDVGFSILVSLRLIDTTTGEVVWQEELSDKIEKYDYMSGYFAQSILNHFKLNVNRQIAEKVETKEEKNKDAVVALSDGINAFDKGDVETAKKELETAKKLDPQSEAAGYYLAKLTVTTSKFKIMYDPFYSADNPAFLGIIKTDSISFSASGNVDEMFLMILFNDHAFIETEAGNEIRELDYRFSLAYAFPVSDSLGFGIEAFMGMIRNDFVDGTDNVYTSRFGLGGVVSGGYKINRNMSIGLSAAAFWLGNWFPGMSDKSSNPDDVIETIALSFSPGFLFRTDDEGFIYDVRFGYCTGDYDVVDPVIPDIDHRAPMPFFLENTFTFAFNNKRTFFIVKQIDELTIDGSYFLGRLLPAVEHYFTDWFSIRAGAEASLAMLNGEMNFGYGALGGITLSNIDWGFDFNLNVSYRLRPSRILEGEMYPGTLLLFSFVWNDVFVSRD